MESMTSEQLEEYLNTTPALAPPDGEVSNFINPETLRAQRIAATSVCVAISMILIALRIYARILIKKVNYEDFALVFSWASFVVFESLIIVAGEYGDGWHQWDVTLARMFKVLMWENYSEIFYCIAMFMLKFVILCQIKAIFFQHNKKSAANWVIWIMIGANFGLFAGLFFAFIFACNPREKIWYQTLVQGTCIDSNAAIAAGSSLNVASDLAILVTPVVGVWRLQLPTKKKLGAGSVFAVGVFALAASILRLYYGVQLFWVEDVTWHISPVGNWTTGEFTAGYMVACFPFFPRLLMHWRGQDVYGTAGYKGYGSRPSAKGGSSTPYASHASRFRSRTDRSYANLEPATVLEHENGNSMDGDTEPIVKQPQVHPQVHPQARDDSEWPIPRAVVAPPHKERIGSWSDATNSMEMGSLGQRVDTQNGINVTRSWKVNDN